MSTLKSEKAELLAKKEEMKIALKAAADKAKARDREFDQLKHEMKKRKAAHGKKAQKDDKMVTADMSLNDLTMLLFQSQENARLKEELSRAKEELAYKEALEKRLNETADELRTEQESKSKLEAELTQLRESHQVGN